jgi:hypothetical protein
MSYPQLLWIDGCKTGRIPRHFWLHGNWLNERLKEGVGLKYRVADSALYTAETLQQLGGFGWVSRVPETLTPAREMTLAVASDLDCNPEPLSYRAICVTYAGIRQRWRVVHTHAARQRAEKTLRKQHGEGCGMADPCPHSPFAIRHSPFAIIASVGL